MRNQFIVWSLFFCNSLIFSMSDGSNFLLADKVALAINYKLNAHLFYYHENSENHNKDLDDLAQIQCIENIILTRMGFTSRNINIDSLSLIMDNMINSNSVLYPSYKETEQYKDYDKGYYEEAVIADKKAHAIITSAKKIQFKNCTHIPSAFKPYCRK